MGCLDENELLQAASGQLDPETEAHLAGCSDCRALVAQALETSHGASTLGGDPSHTREGRVQARTHRAIARGARIGRYVIEEPLGHGGMGTVYAAFDPKIERHVAVKLLHGDATDAARQRRLLHEARVLGALSHPNVVGVHDVGEHDGEVFIAMEMSMGETLTQWIVAHDPALDDVLGVFAQAGDGLAAAHRAGLVHRDFKPDNVLVDGDGRVRVTDFGLAQLSRWHGGDRAVAMPGAGTPAYMAPEQHLKETVGPAADQFSFCVALYQAVYGQHPFGGVAPEGMRDAVTHGELRPPPSGPYRLRALLRRGLARNPRDRFPSMGALLGELQRVRKRKGRRRAIAAAAALTLGLGGGAWGWTQHTVVAGCVDGDGRVEQLWAPTRRAEIAARFGTAGPGALAWANVERAASEFVVEWTRAREDACRDTYDRGEHTVDVLTRRLACLDRGLGRLEATLEMLAADSGDGRLAYAEAAVRQLDAPSTCGADAVMAREKPQDSKSLQAYEHVSRAEAALALGDYAGAIEAATAGVAAAEAASHPGALADARYFLGLGHKRNGDYEKARKALEESYWLAVQSKADATAVRAATALIGVYGPALAKAEPAHRWLRHADAAALRIDDPWQLRAAWYEAVAGLASWESRYAEAAAKQRAALELLERNGRGRSAQAAGVLISMATTASRTSEYEAGLAHANHALEIYRDTVGSWHPDVGTALGWIGNLHMRMGQHEKARKRFEEAYEVLRAFLPERHPRVGAAVNQLGIAYRYAGDYARAEQFFQRSLKIKIAVYGDKHPTVANAWDNVGIMQRLRGNTDEAIVSHRRALDGLIATHGRHHDTIAGTWMNLGNAYVAAGRFKEAIDAQLEALTIWREWVGDEHAAVVRVHSNLGTAYEELGDLAAAERHLSEALRLALDVHGPASSEVGYVRTQLAGQLLAKSDFGGALQHATEAERVFRERGGDPVGLGTAIFARARATWENRGRRTEAVAMARDAEAVLAKVGDDAPGLPEVREWLEAHG